MDRHPVLIVEEDLVVPLGPSLRVAEVAGQALAVCADCADDRQLEILREVLH